MLTRFPDKAVMVHWGKHSASADEDVEKFERLAAEMKCMPEDYDKSMVRRRPTRAAFQLSLVEVNLDLVLRLHRLY